jgi:hypothetical protein
MADNGSKFGALLTWVGGILASIIAGVVIYYATRTPTPPPPPPPTQVGIDGFVLDVASQKPIADAIVTADLGNNLGSQHTDSEGRYAFSVDSTTPAAQSINLDVLAGGYVHYTNTVPIAATGITFAGVQLQPDAALVAPSQLGQSGGAASTPPRPALILRIPKNYAMRADTAALKPK